LEVGPNLSMLKLPPQDSGKTCHKESIPNNEQQDPIFQKNKSTNKYEKIDKSQLKLDSQKVEKIMQMKYLKDTPLDDGLLKS
jgi:hypothetical protein